MLPLGPSPQVEPTLAEFLVLANGRATMAAIDLATGALVRASWTVPVQAAFAPYDVVRAPVAGGTVDDDREPFAPESVRLAEAPARTGRMSGRAAERLLRAVVHPPRQQLFGFAGAAAPFWTLSGDRPSLAVIEPERGPLVERRGDGLRCRFRWRRLDHDLPLDDFAVDCALTHPAARSIGGRALRRALGWEPRRLLVALTPPFEGRCYKVVAALLPRP